MPCSDDSTPLPQERADRGQRKTAAQCAAVRRSAGAVRAPATSLETVLREDDLDAAVLRLAHAIGGGGGAGTAGGGAPKRTLRLATTLCVLYSDLYLTPPTARKVGSVVAR